MIHVPYMRFTQVVQVLEQVKPVPMRVSVARCLGDRTASHTVRTKRTWNCPPPRCVPAHVWTHSQQQQLCLPLNSLTSGRGWCILRVRQSKPDPGASLDWSGQCEKNNIIHLVKHTCWTFLIITGPVHPPRGWRSQACACSLLNSSLASDTYYKGFPTNGFPTISKSWFFLFCFSYVRRIILSSQL